MPQDILELSSSQTGRSGRCLKSNGAVGRDPGAIWLFLMSIVSEGAPKPPTHQHHVHEMQGTELSGGHQRPPSAFGVIMGQHGTGTAYIARGTDRREGERVLTNSLYTPRSELSLIFVLKYVCRHAYSPACLVEGGGRLPDLPCLLQGHHRERLG
jgi:hypothetical protein